MQSVFSPESTDVCLPGKELPLYEDFPYLVTRLISGLYHLIPLPEVFDEASLRSLARYQALCNQLPTCLVLDTTRAISIDTTGKESDPTLPPRGGMIVSDRLRPSPGVERGTWWHERSRRLRHYVEQQRGLHEGWYLLVIRPKAAGPPRTKSAGRFSARRRTRFPAGSVSAPLAVSGEANASTISIRKTW